MTKNTKLYKTYFTKHEKKIDIYYRDLTVLELSFFSNINNDFIRNEMAGKVAIVNMDPADVPYPTIERIGEESYLNSTKEINDEQLLEICVSEFRDTVPTDYTLMCILRINQAFPTQPILELMNLTNKDLIELVVLAEISLGKPLFNFKNGITKKGMNLIDPHSLPDDGKSLQEQMNELNQHIS